MIKYPISDLVLMLSGLQTSTVLLKFAKDPSNPLPDQEYLNRVAVTLDGLHRLGGGIDLDTSLMDQISKLIAFLKAKPERQISAASIKTRLDTIIEGLLDNLKHRMFMFVPADEAVYWDNPELFGGDFLISFPSDAVLELREAGNCLTASRGTACVFHLMRVAEYGLRKLAKRVNATITDKGRTYPIEYGDWNKVIVAVRGKISLARARTKGPKREESLQFYSDAADHCEYMKDIWRNEISHTRRRYNKSETLAVFNRVREFVQLIARHESKKEIGKRLRRIRRVQKVRQHDPRTLSDLAQGFESLVGRGEKTVESE